MMTPVIALAIVDISILLFWLVRSVTYFTNKNKYENLLNYVFWSNDDSDVFIQGITLGFLTINITAVVAYTVLNIFNII